MLTNCTILVKNKIFSQYNDIHVWHICRVAWYIMSEYHYVVPTYHHIQCQTPSNTETWAYQNKLLCQHPIKWGSIIMKAYCDQVTVYNDEVLVLSWIMKYNISEVPEYNEDVSGNITKDQHHWQRISFNDNVL